MSTRSGKRIHNSFHEDNVKTTDDMVVRSERKTRSKHLKENLDIMNCHVNQPKKRKNYVKYPSDDDLNTDASAADVVHTKSHRVLRGNALKEQNIVIEANIIESPKKYIRTTRSNKKLSENETENIEESNNNRATINTIVEKPKVKKTKKKIFSEVLNNEYVEKLKKKSKKKMSRDRDSQIIEEPVENKEGNTSVDSFYSDEGSPSKIYSSVRSAIKTCENTPAKPSQKNKNAKRAKKKTSSAVIETKDTTFEEMEVDLNGIMREKPLKCNEKVVNKNINTTYDNDDVETEIINKDLTFDKENEAAFCTNNSMSVVTTDAVNNKSDKSKKKRNSLINTTFDKDVSTDAKNNTYNMDEDKIKQKKYVLSTTFTNDDNTFEQQLEEFVNRSPLKESTSDKVSSDGKTTIKDITFENYNSSLIYINNVTFEKESNSDKGSKKCSKDTTSEKIDSSSYNTTTLEIDLNMSNKSRKSTLKKTTSVLKNYKPEISDELQNITPLKEAIFEKENSCDNTFDMDSQDKSNTGRKSLRISSTLNNYKIDESSKKMSLNNITFEKESSRNNTFDMDSFENPSKRKKSIIRKSASKLANDDIIITDDSLNNTLEKNCTFDKETSENNTFDIDSSKAQSETKKSIMEKNNSSFKKNKNTVTDCSLNESSAKNATFEKDNSDNNTFDIDSNKTPSKKRKSFIERSNSILKNDKTTVTDNFLNQSSAKDATFEKDNSDSNTFDTDSNKTPNKRRKSIIERSNSTVKNGENTVTDGSLNQSSAKDATFEKDNSHNNTFDIDSNKTLSKKRKSFIERSNSTLKNDKTTVTDNFLNQSSAKDATFEKDNSDSNTFDTDSNKTPNKRRKSIIERSNSTVNNGENTVTDGSLNQSSAKDATFEKDKSHCNIFHIDSNKTPSKRRKYIIEKNFNKILKTQDSPNYSSAKDATFDKESTENNTFDIESNEKPNKKMSIMRRNSTEIEIKLTNQFTSENDKQKSSIYTETDLNETFDKTSKSSLISSDSSTDNIMPSLNSLNNISSISITSDESENIVNTTPLLIESSIDESLKPVQTPLKREGTFTKDSDSTDPMTPKLPSISPTRKPTTLMSAGCTPLHPSGSKKSVINITRSLEKDRRSSVELAPRVTKVMFCSPVFDPVVASQQKRKIIKSNLKGSNKSFIFEESAASPKPARRKRSYTQSDADDRSVKRTRLADCQQQSVDRLSRPRTSSSSAKLSGPESSSKKTPQKAKAESKVSRTKLPNFAALHRKQFDQMESLNECQERKARRAKQLLTPTGAIAVLERSSPKSTVSELQKQKAPTKFDSNKSLPTLESLKPGYTRFGFKLNVENNPFIAPRNMEKPKNPPKILPSLSGSTVRKDVAKQVVMRERSFTDKRVNKRNENRTIIKGVRTNRRFELQMKMRNID